MRHLVKVLIISLPLILALNAMSMPKYIDKKKAITLALALEKGQFKGTQILAAYAMNRGDKYYVSVTLSNGKTERWFLGDIFEASREGELTLKGNRVLVFSDPTSPEFDILDKNSFHRMALNAKSIRLVHDDLSDPLASQSLVYKIKEFFLVPPAETQFGKDAYGYPYRYKVDMHNGCESVLLSYRDVVKFRSENHFLTDAVSSGLQPLERPYKVKSVIGYPKTDNQIYSQFGLEITFDRDIELAPEHFPAIIKEKGSGLKNGEKTKSFMVEIIMPNTLTQKVIRMQQPKTNNQLEYLSDIKVTQNTSNRCQSTLSAVFNHQIMDIPPYITKIAKNKIYVTFFNITDQTINEPPISSDDAENIVFESQKWLVVSPSIKLNSDFGRVYNQALSLINEGYYESNYSTSVGIFKKGINMLEQAALLTNNDNSLLEILGQRNAVRKQISSLSIQQATNLLSEDEPNTGLIKEYLLTADEFADSDQLKRDINKIARRVGL